MCLTGVDTFPSAGKAANAKTRVKKAAFFHRFKWLPLDKNAARAKRKPCAYTPLVLVSIFDLVYSITWYRWDVLARPFCRYSKNAKPAYSHKPSATTSDNLAGQALHLGMPHGWPYHSAIHPCMASCAIVLATNSTCMPFRRRISLTVRV